MSTYQEGFKDGREQGRKDCEAEIARMEKKLAKYRRRLVFTSDEYLFDLVLKADEAERRK